MWKNKKFNKKYFSFGDNLVSFNDSIFLVILTFRDKLENDQNSHEIDCLAYIELTTYFRET